MFEPAQKLVSGGSHYFDIIHFWAQATQKCVLAAAASCRLILNDKDDFKAKLWHLLTKQAFKDDSFIITSLTLYVYTM